jgi:hypothetical protein
MDIFSANGDFLSMNSPESIVKIKILTIYYNCNNSYYSKNRAKNQCECECKSQPALKLRLTGESEKTERECSLCFSTRSRGRTGTVLLPLVFETSASTSSAIRAGWSASWRTAKIEKTFIFLLSFFIFLKAPSLPSRSPFDQIRTQQ